MSFDFITEPARHVPVIHHTNVLVVGSGPSGLAAALAAARAGVQVCMVERFGYYGGNITVVGVEGLGWYRHQATIEANGIGREFEDRAKAMGAAVPESQSLSYELDSEGFKLVADLLVEEAGIHGMMHRTFVAPVMAGNHIAGIIEESNAGLEAILAKVVIDATGDADVAVRCGALAPKTPSEHMQGASVMSHLAGVNKAELMAEVKADPQTDKDWSTGEGTLETDSKEDDMFSPFLKKPFARAIEERIIPKHLTTIAGTWGAMHDIGELTYMNLVHLGRIDGTAPDSMTQGEVEGRKQAMLAIEALRHFMQGCKGVRLRNFGMNIGIRVTQAEVIAFCRNIIAYFNAPKTWALRALPKTASGKIQKFILRAIAHEMGFQP
jgi:ribulose 1,5-bisphosphate synthetase/thiazole synthase